MKKKIVIGPLEIAGNVHSLYKALNLIGEDCSIFLNRPHPHHAPICYIQKLHIFVSKIDFLIIRKLFRVGVYLIGYLHAFYYIATKDIFIFYFGTTFLPFYLDLKIIRFLNKKCFMVYCGADSRFPLIDGARLSNLDEKEAVRVSNDIIKKLRVAEKYCDGIVSNPFSSQLHDKKIINFLVLGLPYFTNEFQKKKLITTKKIRVLHAPSDTLAKGSKKIKSIVEELAKVYSIEYIELKGVSHSEVAEKIIESDIVIDQLYCDVPLAGLATEALNYGKPVFVGSYVTHGNMQRFLDVKLDFVIFHHPDRLKETLTYYLENPGKLNELVANGQTYLDKYLKPELIAKRWQKVLYNQLSADWIINPKLVKYPFGAGISKSFLKKRLKELNIDFSKINLPEEHYLIQELKKLQVVN